MMQTKKTKTKKGQQKSEHRISNIAEREKKKKVFSFFVCVALVIAAGNSESRLPSGHADILTPQRTPGPDEVFSADDVACEHPTTEMGGFAAVWMTLGCKEMRWG
jgi:hypothetical protein